MRYVLRTSVLFACHKSELYIEMAGRCISNVAETRTGVDEYESMDVDAASGGAGPQRCE